MWLLAGFILVGFWLEALFPHHIGFSTKTAYNMEASFPRVRGESKNKSEPEKKVSEF